MKLLINLQNLVNFLLLVLILSKSKNGINNYKNNKILAKLKVITFENYIIILIYISIKSRKICFGFGNLFVNDSK